jgi:hypothetical protein
MRLSENWHGLRSLLLLPESICNAVCRCLSGVQIFGLSLSVRPSVYVMDPLMLLL